MAVLDERLLIPFKAKAYLDLAARRDAGDPVDGKTVRKHRSDVFRLLQLLPDAERITLPSAIAVDLAGFADKVEADGDLVPKDLGLEGDAASLIVKLRTSYGL